MNFFKNICYLGKDFFIDKETRTKAILLLSLSIVLQFILVYAQVLMNKWYAGFYNALQNANKAELYDSIKTFCLAVSFMILIFISSFISVSYLVINWRKYITHKYVDKWMNSKAYIANNLLPNKIDNPDQRLSEDLNSFTSLTGNLFFQVINSFITLVSFISILWNLSGIVKFTIANINFTLHGYMVWAVLAYCIIGTFITFKIGKRLVKLDFEQEKKEANFRFSLMRARENANNIIFYQGEEYEKNIFKNALQQVIDNNFSIIKIQKNLSIWSNFYNNFANIFPILLSAPRLFAKEIQLGEVMQIANAFGKVQDSLSILISNYQSLANYKAVITRLSEFDQHIRSWENTIKSNKINCFKKETNLISVKSLFLNSPSLLPLQQNLNLNFNLGQSYLIRGRNGCGKSTFTAALAGYWPYGEGLIELPQDKNIFYIPQKTFLHSLTLIEEICYPQTEVKDKEYILTLLEKINLTKLKYRLYNQENWSSSLSLGEQQKIAFLRAILNKPGILIMDESSSALSIEDEEIAYKLIKDELPDVTLISIGHRDTLKKFHQHEIIFS